MSLTYKQNRMGNDAMTTLPPTDLAAIKAEAYQRGAEDMRERAASRTADFPSARHGFLPVDPFQCAAEVAREIAAAIRSLPTHTQENEGE